MITLATRTVHADAVRPGNLIAHPDTGVALLVTKLAFDDNGIELVCTRDGWKSSVKITATPDQQVTVLAGDDVLDTIERQLLAVLTNRDADTQPDVLLGRTGTGDGEYLTIEVNGLDWDLLLREGALETPVGPARFVQKATASPPSEAE